MPTTTHILFAFTIFLLGIIVPEAVAQQSTEGERRSVKTASHQGLFVGIEASADQRETRSFHRSATLTHEEVAGAMLMREEVQPTAGSGRSSSGRSSVEADKKSRKGWWDAWGQCTAGTLSGATFFGVINSDTDYAVGQPWGAILGAVGGAMLFGAINC